MLRVVLLGLICVVPSLCESEMGSIQKPERTKLQGVQCTKDDMNTGNSLANSFCEHSTKMQDSKQKEFEKCITKTFVRYGRSECLPQNTNIDLNKELCENADQQDERTQKILCCYGAKVNREGKKDMAYQMLQECSSKFTF